MPLADYVSGLAFLAVTLGGVGLATALLVRRRLGHLAGAPRVVAASLVFVAGVVAVHLVPGVLGVLSRWTVLAATALAVVGALRLAPVDSEPEARPAPPQSGRVSIALAALAAGALTAYTAAAAWRASAVPSAGVDTLTFHLPNVARWIQGGSLWQVDHFVPIWSLGNYPQTGDVVTLASVLPWENDAFAQLVNVPFVALAAFAVYAIALELGAPRATAVIFACLVPAIPEFTEIAHGGTMPDVILVAVFSGGVLFLLRAGRHGRTSDLLLGGLGLGLAFGAKWNGVAVGVTTVVVFAAALPVARPPLRLVAGRTAVAGGVMLAVGGFWFLRNLVKSGNPIIPVKVELAGVTVFDAPPDEVRECVGNTIAQYLTSPDVWADYIWPGYRQSLGWPALACAVALVGALVILAVRRPPIREAAPVLGVAALAIALVAVYTITPFSALGHEGEPVLAGDQSRYLFPPLALAAAVGAFAAGRLGRARVVAEALATLAVLAGLWKGFEVSTAAVVGGTVVLLAAGAVAWRLRPPPALAWAAAAAVALVLVVVGYERQQTFNDARYADPAEPALTWIRDNARSDTRIALAGAWDLEGTIPVLPAFGPDLDNEVEYVADTDQRVLREYTSRDDWVRAVRGGDFDLLLVARGGYDRRCPIPGSETDEEEWARAEGFPIVAQSHRLILHRLPD